MSNNYWLRSQANNMQSQRAQLNEPHPITETPNSRNLDRDNSENVDPALADLVWESFRNSNVQDQTVRNQPWRFNLNSQNNSPNFNLSRRDREAISQSLNDQSTDSLHQTLLHISSRLNGNNSNSSVTNSPVFDPEQLLFWISRSKSTMLKYLAIGISLFIIGISMLGGRLAWKFIYEYLNFWLQLGGLFIIGGLIAYLSNLADSFGIFSLKSILTFLWNLLKFIFKLCLWAVTQVGKMCKKSIFSFEDHSNERTHHSNTTNKIDPNSEARDWTNTDLPTEVPIKTPTSLFDQSRPLEKGKYSKNSKPNKTDRLSRKPAFYPEFSNEVSGPSGGWGGEEIFFASTPGGTNPSSESKQVRFSERSSFSYPKTGELSSQDLSVLKNISNSNATTYTYTPEVPKFSTGKREDYIPWRREWISVAPAIPPMLRLSTLRKALDFPEGKRILDEFEGSDENTLIKAMIALDEEYNNPDEMSSYLLDKIQSHLSSSAFQTEETFGVFMSELTSLLRRFSKVEADASVHLAPLAKTWFCHLPESISRIALKYIREDRKWLTFDHLFNLCEGFAKESNRTKDLQYARLKVQRSMHKGKPNSTFHVNCPDIGLGFCEEEGSSYDVNFSGRFMDVPLCCFCGPKGDGHHSIRCPNDKWSPEERRTHASKLGLCFTCLEKHKLGLCPLIRSGLASEIQCGACKSGYPHCKSLCVNSHSHSSPSVVTHK